ncbi:MAG: glycerol kinase GlpK [Bacteroidales bacterium]|nr:glycerol kinase GlpK [Bacteroidales bacterium]MDT8430987.1 glycerol kinase GlpK [Bacteroidales bacterium]
MIHKKYVLSLDQGTTSSRAILFDHDGRILGQAQKEFRQIFPKPGWVEHDPEEIWSSQSSVTAEVIAKAGVRSEEISSIGITNQRETVVVWDRETGKPVHNAIVWQDRRTSEYCSRLVDEGRSEMVRSKTGLIIDAYFSATKARWILDNVEGARKKAEQGRLCFGTIDSWLIWKFTRGKTHVTDITNASRTMLFNIYEDQWDQELLHLFNIPAPMLPEVKGSSELFAETSGDTTGFRLPIMGVAGDQQAALFGQLCLEPGMVKNTYGTGCFLVMNLGGEPVTSKSNLLTTVAWKLDGKISYALEGSIFVAGAIIQWIRDELGLIGSAAETEKIARSVADNGGVYLVPALTGLGAPHWDQFARGTIMGLTRGSGKAHIVRAALESIAYQVTDVVQAMQEDAGETIAELRVDGGASSNDFLMQFQSDMLNTTVTRPGIMETTALGAAYLAGLASGFWKDTDELQKQWIADKHYRPDMESTHRNELLNNWQKAVSRALNWLDRE